MSARELENPARELCAAIREVLERMVVDLGEQHRRADRTRLKAALDEALGGAEKLGASDPLASDHFDLIDGARGRLVALRGAYEELGKNKAAERAVRSVARLEARIVSCRERVIEILVAAEKRALRAPGQDAAPPPPPFRASVGTPSLHCVPGRSRIAAPFAEVEDDDTEVDDEEEDTLASGRDAASQTSAAPAPGAAPRYDEVAHARRLARGCMEGLSALGALRRLEPDERWVDVAPFEQRLLDQLDALVALGTPVENEPTHDVVRHVMEYAAEPVFVDRGRAFARSFALGCIEGDDLGGAIVLSLRQAHPITLDAHRSALSLASSPAVPILLRKLLQEGDARLVELALEALRFRHEVSFADAALLLAHPDEGVVAVAASCLAQVPERAAALELLGALDFDAIDVGAQVLVIDAMLRQGSRRGLQALRAWLAAAAEAPAPDSVFDAVVDRLAVAGARGDRDLLLASRRADPRGAEAIAWFGDPGLVPQLIQDLEVGEELQRRVGPPSPLQIATAVALHRITGARLLVPPEAVPITEVTTDLSLDPRVWQAYWKDNAARFGGGGRFRFGHPYTVELSLAELAADDTSRRDRERCLLELSLHFATSQPQGAAQPVRLELDDWVAQQRAEIEVLRARVDESPRRSGQFFGDHLRA